ncbi:MAG: ABC transporter substrate-binding protein, partial [Oligoflexales bacterium]|nr:ABC transporter substrate-binding protein [Oligoflexales bacterium]
AEPALPKDIKWETNEKTPPISSKDAKTGGVFKTYMDSYPLTFRLFGPNSNDMFANWNRAFCFFDLVERHPNTLDYIPILATHWAVMKDQKTVYYKLNPNVRFSDGVNVTADNYVEAFKALGSEFIKDPFYNKYIKEKIQGVEKIDKYTIKITGTYSSWRALGEFTVSPWPYHAVKLDENWVKRDNWTSPVCVGPYKLDKVKEGSYVNFTRIKNFWGESHVYLRNRFNFERINIKVIRDENMAFEHFKKGELTAFHVATASRWEKDTDFDAIKKGWIVKRKIYVKSPKGIYGIIMNLKAPILKERNFRKALQHLFDFNKINKNIMYGAYIRMNSFFEGTEYEKKDLASYPYDPKKAAGYLAKAGWNKRGSDGILLNGNGQRCSFSLTYGGEGLTRHLSIYVEDLKAAGVEMKLRMVDSAKSFNDLLEKNFESALVSMSGGIYPAPKEYLNSDFAKIPQTNNFFSFSNPEVDRLIEIYEKDLNFENRKKALARVDEIVKDDAFYIPFWTAPFIRELFWNNLGYPPELEPAYSSSINDYYTFWYDQSRDDILKKAMSSNTPIPGVNDMIEMDPHGVLKK